MWLSCCSWRVGRRGWLAHIVWSPKAGLSGSVAILLVNQIELLKYQCRASGGGLCFHERRRKKPVIFLFMKQSRKTAFEAASLTDGSMSCKRKKLT